MKITVVIPAYNSTATLRDCVDRIAIQLVSVPAAEIIIVDNGKNQNLLSLLKGLPVRIMERTVLASAAYARNQGCRQIQSGIIVFIDSDVLIDDNCIAKLVAPIAKGQCDATIGNYSTQVATLRFAQQYKQLYIHQVYASREQVVRNDFWTAICAIDATAFHAVGGFNPDFNGACGEDQELGIRLTRAGSVIHRIADAQGLHLHNYTIYKIIKNDLRKGLTVMHNTLVNKVPVTDHSHASGRNVLSVCFASFATLTGLLAILPGYTILGLTALLALMVWLFLKSELLRLFYKKTGLWFVVKCIPLMLLLDLVRAYCVAANLLSLPLHSIKRNWIPIKEQSESSNI